MDVRTVTLIGQGLGPIDQKGALACLHKGPTPAWSLGPCPQLLEQPTTLVTSVDAQTLQTLRFGGSVAKG